MSLPLLPFPHDIENIVTTHDDLYQSDVAARRFVTLAAKEVINNLFRHSYTKIEFLMEELMVHRNTASRHLDELVRIGILAKHKIGKDNYYLNTALFDLLHGAGSRLSGALT